MITINTNKLFRLALIAVIALLAVGISPGSAERLTLQPLPAPLVDPDDMGTAFTYQGRLMSGGNPADGNYDFKFELYDDAGDTTETLLDTIEVDMLPVANGLFMVDLDFGAGNFLGFERWLEINVRPGADEEADPYTTLSPRQQINPAPYATFARTIYRKTMVVKPVGSNAANGAALMQAYQSIIDDSPGPTNRYLLKIEPGVYYIGSTRLSMIDSVDIEGSGEDITFITGDGMFNENAGTVIGASNAEIRNLTIENIDTEVGLPYNIAFYNNDGASPTLTHVTLVATAYTGGTGIGMANHTGTSPSLIDSTIRVGTKNANATQYGIRNIGSSPTLDDVNIYVESGLHNYGIYNEGEIPGADAYPVVRESRIEIYSNVEGEPDCVGIYNGVDSDLWMSNSEVEVMSCYRNYAVQNDHADNIQILDSYLYVIFGGNVNWAVTNLHSHVTLNNVLVQAYYAPQNLGITSTDSELRMNNCTVDSQDGYDVEGVSHFGQGYLEITDSIIQASGGCSPVGPGINKGINIQNNIIESTDEYYSDSYDSCDLW